MSESMEYQPIPEAPKPNSNRNLIIGIIIGVVVLCCCCIGGVLLFYFVLGDPLMEMLEDFSRLAPSLISLA